MGSRSLMGRGNFEGEGRPIVKYKDSAVSCTKTAEPIEMPSGYMDSDGPKEACIRVQIPMRRGQFLGERTCPGMPDDNRVHVNAN